MTTDLTYNIADGLLSGSIGAIQIKCHAGSGGRSGTKTQGAFNPILANNAFATHVHSGGHIFGPLPQGRYHMPPHETDSHMVRLTPFKTNHMYGRNGFLIHGRGKIGSHGCIVPPDFNDVLKICKAVKQVSKNGQQPVLTVVAVGTDLDAKLKLASSLA